MSSSENRVRYVDLMGDRIDGSTIDKITYASDFRICGLSTILSTGVNAFEFGEYVAEFSLATLFSSLVASEGIRKIETNYIVCDDIKPDDLGDVVIDKFPDEGVLNNEEQRNYAKFTRGTYAISVGLASVSLPVIIGVAASIMPVLAVNATTALSPIFARTVSGFIRWNNLSNDKWVFADKDICAGNEDIKINSKPALG